MSRFLRFLKLLAAGKHRWSRCWMGFHDWDFPGGHCRRCQKCDEFFLPHEICRQEKIQCPGLPNENGLCLVCCNKAWPNAEHHPRCPNRPLTRRIIVDQKPKLSGLVRDNPMTPEGKYLVKRRDGSVVEWPSFVLGARDPHAAVALRAYADSIEKDPDVHPDFPARLRRLADEFDAYRATHGAGDPTRGLHRKDDPATIAEMRNGMSA